LLLPENPPLLVREVLALLAETRHPVAEQVLTLFLSTLEEALLSSPAGAGEACRERWRCHLDETSVALARHGTPRARAALVEHGLRTEPELSGAAERLAALGRCDLSASPELVVAGCSRPAGPSYLRVFARRHEQARRLLNLVTALAGSSRADGVRQLLELVAARFPEHDFGRKAADVLRAPVAGRSPIRSIPGPASSGNLTVFGLPHARPEPGADLRVSGELTLMDPDGRRAATLEFERGRLCQAQHGA
jgi:hypothetical protein